MKEADIFESWINRLAEGTWEEPKTPEQVNKLKELLSKELIVGPDATNAKEVLDGIVGDDILFDRLESLPATANAWNDTGVMDRLRELGIDTTPQEPAGVQAQEPQAPVQDMPEEPEMAPVSEADNISTFESINAMRKAAGLPVQESVLTDSTGHTLDHILKSFSREVKDFKEGGELNDKLYHALYDYYFDDMPHNTKHNTSGEDSYEWITDRLDSELGTGNYAPRDITPTLETMPNLSAPVAEGSCNMTMEGEYCPEHGLMECGSMYEMGTVAGSVAPVVMGEGAGTWKVYDDEEFVMDYNPVKYEIVNGKDLVARLDAENIDFTHVVSPMGIKTYAPGLDPRAYPKDDLDEGNDDPINSNSAITGAYYESKSDDALLARIKSLALIK